MPDPFLRFTERARKVLTYAQVEAHHLKHGYVGTEHLLLGLVREGDGVAARALADVGVDLPRARRALDDLVGRGDTMFVGELALTPHARTAIELAVKEARKRDHHFVGTEHLLLALVREGDGIAADVLRSLGVDLELLRSRVDERMAVRPSESPERPAVVEPAQIHTLMGALAHALRTRPDLAGDAETRRRAGDLHALLGEWLAHTSDGSG
ncbi:MAG TPA: Clp protease N-terminal domain-containing protein [Thermomicrobiaceae bacterium]|nr:Clp protease N-terminal domain-containing protein [Thermomicrobiaceae bacterium]